MNEERTGPGDDPRRPHRKVALLAALAVVAILALGVSPGALAQTGGAFKGVYFGGQMFIFQSTMVLFPTPSTDLSVLAIVWDAN